jgi:hypothetical protein
MSKYISVIFWASVLNFVFIVCLFFVPLVRELFRSSAAFFIPFITLFLLGSTLAVLAHKSKVRTSLRRYLLLTGISAAGILAGIILHNIIYGLFIYFFGADFWDRTGFGDEPLFFLIALVACPIGFLIGAAGSIAGFSREKKEDLSGS